MIEEFLGTERIIELAAYPLIHHPERVELEERLLERGRRFENLQGYHFKAYYGEALHRGVRGYVTENIDGRIIIDTLHHNRVNPSETVSVARQGKLGMQLSKRELANQGTTKEKEAPKIPLTRDQLLMILFFIESVREITWSEDAFKSLVLPQSHKELILAFAESQLQNKTFDDVIRGKGRGIILLLSGPPGVGKTLTAESVAETMRVPLYAMSAGDISPEPSEVGSDLSRIFDMVTRWNAVLLLDEADVFLEARSTHDLERNRLVSIFLRTLEYYEGILFLTTNRVESFDAAFQSRIHVSIDYPDLSASSRRQVWSTFLSRSTRDTEISDQEQDSLAAMALNGRQIKNVMKTSQLLAARKKAPLRRGLELEFSALRPKLLEVFLKHDNYETVLYSEGG
ncbi:MAG: Arginine N-methyltransferase 2 [Chaenotheca gracillima]|nr:MAG: Arginine N-methyltransferase 2 [Chaenotheca gracillima]